MTAVLAMSMWATAPGSIAQGWDTSVEFVQSVGRIDWEDNLAVASGVGLPPGNVRNRAQRRTLARRAAVIDARRNLMEVVGQVRIDSTTKVLNAMVVSDVTRARVSGMLQGSVVTSERQMPDGSFVVEVAAPIRPALTAAVMDREQAPPLKAKLQPVAAVSRAPHTAPVVEHDIAEQVKPSPLAQAQAPDYTGIVIDARGTGFTPSLIPKISGPGGALYPVPGIAKDVAAANGLVRYFSDMAKAQQSDRAGNKPLTIKAKAGAGSSELTVSQEDAATLSRLSEDPESPLNRAQVVVVF